MSNGELSQLCSRVTAFIGDAQAATDAEFEELALEIFRFQYANNSPYRGFCERARKTPKNVSAWRDIPAIVTSAFKDLELSVMPAEERTRVFYSSGTSEQRPSRHLHSPETLRVYEESLLRWFKRHVVPNREKADFLMLSPYPWEVPHSSLAHMFDTVSSHFGTRVQFVGKVSAGGSWMIDFARLESTLGEVRGRERPVVICGTAFSFVHWCDHLEENGAALSLPAGSRVFETGGYKGRSRTIPKAELHDLIEKKLGIPRAQIISEYGMSELSSQAYDRVLGDGGPRIFHFPLWARATVISPETLHEVKEGEAGLIRVCDLANIGSVMAIQTEDLAIRRGDGFELIGRSALAEPRGCSLLELSS